MHSLMAQVAPPANLLEYLDTLATFLVLGCFITILMRGDLRLGREVTTLSEDRERERTVHAERVAALEAQLTALAANRDVEVGTWRAAYEDQCAAREAAERAGQNAMDSGRVTLALLDALNSAREGKG